MTSARTKTAPADSTTTDTAKSTPEDSPMPAAPQPEAEQSSGSATPPSDHPTSEFKPAANVIAAIARVEAEIGGIGKTKPKGSTLGYAYRGIDAITSQAQPLFGREGIVIVPTRVRIESVQDVQVGGKPWTSTLVNVDWTIYGPGGVDDCIESTTYGVGLDNSDKGCNKGTTQAYKNLILRILSIGDPQDDADQPEHQRNYVDGDSPPETPRPPDPPISPEEQEAREIFEAIRGLSVDDKKIYVNWVNSLDQDHPKVTVPVMAANNEWRATVLDAVGKILMPVASPLGEPEPDDENLFDGQEGLGESDYEGDAGP